MPVYTLALLWRWPSPVRRQTANLVLYELGGSNPPLHAFLPSGSKSIFFQEYPLFADFSTKTHKKIIKSDDFRKNSEPKINFQSLDFNRFPTIDEEFYFLNYTTSTTTHTTTLHYTTLHYTTQHRTTR